MTPMRGTRQFVMIALPEGSAVEDVRCPPGSVYAATTVSLEAIEHSAPGLSRAVGHKLVGRVLDEITSRPAWRQGVGGKVWIDWCGELFPGVVSHQVAADHFNVIPGDLDAVTEQRMRELCVPAGGWVVAASSIRDRS